MSITTFIDGMGVARGAGSLDDDETSARGEALQARLGTAEFLASGAESKVWFELSDEVRARIMELTARDARRLQAFGGKVGASGGDAIVQALDAYLDSINLFLARPDVSDGMKQRFLSQMFGTATDAYDDTEDLEATEKWRGLGTVIAECMVGDEHTLEAMFVTGNQEAISVRDLTEMISSATDAATKFMNDNKIDPEPDKSIAYLSSLSLLAEAEAKRRKGMTSGELVEDILRSRTELRADIESRKREHAAGAPSAGRVA